MPVEDYIVQPLSDVYANLNFHLVSRSNGSYSLINLLNSAIEDMVSKSMKMPELAQTDLINSFF